MSVWIRNFVLIVAAMAPGLAFFAQGTSKTEALKKIKTIEDAESLLKKTYPSGAIGRFNSIIDSAEYKEITRNYGVGDIFYGKKQTYKILKKEKETIYHCQYIFLDGNIHSREKIDSVRNEIIARFNSGTSFRTLAEKYSMDFKKKGGEMGWFHKEKMGEEFMQTFEKHPKGQIFTCDVASKKAYYVVLKTHSPIISDSWVYITLK